MMPEKARALLALKDCAVIRANAFDGVFSDLEAAGYASGRRVPLSDLSDFRLTHRGHRAANSIERPTK